MKRARLICASCGAEAGEYQDLYDHCCCGGWFRENREREIGRIEGLKEAVEILEAKIKEAESCEK